MKYIISESKLQDAIYEYIEELFDISEINWTHPYEYDEDDYESEDETRIEFYNGAYSDEDTVFRYYNCDYFYEGTKSREICPTVSLEYEYENRLNGLFGDELWKAPFKKWFESNFDLKVKTVDTRGIY
jgi:hypothetical protein